MFQRQPWIICFFSEFHSYFHCRTTGGTCISGQNTCTFCTFFVQPFFQLSIKNTARLYMIVGLCPFTVTGELCPTTVCTVHRIFCRGITFDFRCRTLPKQAVCRIPTGSVFILSQILESQVMTVDIYYVKQQSACPGINRTTESQRFVRITLYKSIGTGCAISGSKVMNTLFRIAALK